MEFPLTLPLHHLFFAAPHQCCAGSQPEGTHIPGQLSSPGERWFAAAGGGSESMTADTGLGVGAAKLAVQMPLDEMFHEGEILFREHWLVLFCTFNLNREKEDPRGEF